jgi:hypothetical protein
MNLEIKIEEPLKGSKSQAIFFGKSSRVPSHTDIAFLSKDKFVIAHRFAGKLYLVKARGNTFQILNTLSILYKGLRDFPDLICTDYNLIYIVNFNNILHVIDTAHDIMRIIKSIVLHPTFSYHGLCISDKKLYATATVRIKDEAFVITEYDLVSQNIRHLPIIGNPNRLKDICFLNSDLCIVITSFNDREIGFGKKKEVYDGEIVLCSFNKTQFTVVDTLPFTQCHFDSIICKKNIFYCTSTFVEEGSYILIGEIIDNKIINIQKHPCEAFPHGIDIYEDTLGYTSYGTSTTYIKQLPLT